MNGLLIYEIITLNIILTDMKKQAVTNIVKYNGDIVPFEVNKLMNSLRPI